MKIRTGAGLGLLAAVGSACVSVGVTPSGSGIAVAPKPADCRIEFLRSKVPERAYDEIAGLHASGSNVASPSALQEAMQSKACLAGADAVIVTRDFIATQSGSLMTGTAIKYREPAANPAPGASAK